MASDKTEHKLTLEFARYELFTIFLPGVLHCLSTVLTYVLYNGLLPGFLTASSGAEAPHFLAKLALALPACIILGHLVDHGSRWLATPRITTSFVEL